MEKIKNFFDNDKLLIKILLIFIIMQPFLDIEIFFTNSSLEIAGITIPTFIRCVGIFVMALFSLKNIRLDKAHIFYFIYFILLLVYFLIHHIVVSKTMVIPEDYTYSLFSEAFYMFRMLLPFLIVYIVKYSKIKYKDFIKVIMYTSIIIGLVVFISNTFCISLTAYPTDVTDYNSVNWLSWNYYTFANFNFEALTSKGWFYMANQLSGVMILLLPINLYELIRKPSRTAVISTLLLIISMIMVSTRIAAYGWIAVIAIMFVLFIFFKYIFRNLKTPLKNLLVVACLLPMIIAFFINSPIFTRNYVYTASGYSDLEKTEDKDKIYSYIENNYYKFGIQTAYIMDIYHYEFDYDFWLEIFEMSKVEVFSNRQMEVFMTNRIAELNGNKLENKLFGYSFSRMRNGELYIEHDFLAQYKTMGILGVILLLGPYLVLMFYMFYDVLIKKHFKNCFNLKNITLILSMAIILSVSIISGHILDELFVTIYIAFITGFMFKSYMEKEE